MGARRFFVDGTFERGSRVQFFGSDAHKIANVLRLRSGDAVDVVDSAGTSFTGILDVDAGNVAAVLASVRGYRASRGPGITVAQGLPKGQKMDFVVEKLTELGATAIVPFSSERSVVRDAGEAKIERWRRLAKTAAQQSGCDSVPRVDAERTFAELLGEFARYDVCLVAWELASETLSAGWLRERLANAGSVLVAIGPEGGFSHAEAEAAAASGANLVSLGARILRTETAGLVVLSILNFMTAE